MGEKADSERRFGITTGGKGRRNRPERQDRDEWGALLRLERVR